MRLEELADRHEPLHRVSAVIGLYVAIVACRRTPLHVLASVGTPRGIIRHEVVAVAILDERLFAMVELWQLPFPSPRNHRTFGRKPMDAEFTLKEGENAVHRAALGSAPDEKVVPEGFVGEALVVLPGFPCSRQVGHTGVETHEDALSVSFGVVCDGQTCAAYLLYVLLQLSGSRLFRGGCLGRNDNLIVALAATEQPVGSPGHGCQEQQDKGY